MNTIQKIFRKIFSVNIIILLVFLFNFYLFYINQDFFKNIDNFFDYFLIMLVLVAEATFVIIIVNLVYKRPITQLENFIKRFVIGGYKETDNIEFPTTSDPQINYILLFFSKILNGLKGLKKEFFEGKAIKGEVELAEEIQGKFLNKKIVEVPNFQIVAASRAAGEIGGDSYDIIRQKDNYYIYVGDATGHGVGAGFIMVMVNSLIEAFSRFLVRGDEILANTNSILKPRLKANLLKTLLLVRYNSSEERLFMTGAGHEYLLIYKNKNKKCYKIKSGGVALGMLKDISKFLKEREIKLDLDDIIVLYSDGITEAINQSVRDGNEQMFGEEKLIKAIEKAPELYGKGYKTARSVFNNITIELSKFMGYKYKQLDDITLVVMHYKGDKIIEDNAVLDESLITEWNWQKNK